MREEGGDTMAKVLIVDDDRVNRELMSALLEEMGEPTLLANDGRACLDICRSEDVGVVLLDVMMPGLDGYEVCRTLKDDPATNLVPVILVTALGDRAARVRGIQAGADDFLTKPVDSGELVPRVRSALRTHHLIGQTQTVYALAASLSSALEARDAYTHQHANRVANYASRTAEHMGIHGRERRDLYLGGLLHDIGKVGIPDAILRKPGPLSLEEFQVVQTHPDIGAHICEATRGLGSVAAIVRCHHERWDGTGYPQGLANTATPLLARIVSVADAFDAMTTNRPYHLGVSVEEACDELLRCRGTQFDPTVVDAFLSADVHEMAAEVAGALQMRDVLRF